MESHSQQATDLIPPRPWYGLHKRTIAILFLFVAVPWYFICIPETRLSNETSLSSELFRCVSGWPMVHREGYRVAEEMSDLEALSLSEQTKGLLTETDLLNLRFERQNRTLTQPYITNAFSLPDPTTSYRWIPQGIIINALVFLAALILVWMLAEWRIRRRGRLIPFPLVSLPAALVLIGGLIFWLLETQQIEKLRYDTAKQFENYTSPGIDSIVLHEDETVLPLLISQLLNHGDPFINIDSDQPGFYRIVSGKASLIVYHDPYSLDPQSEIIDDCKTMAIPVDLTVDYCERGVWYSQQLEQAGVSVQELDVNFNIFEGKKRVPADVLAAAEQQRLFPDMKFPDVITASISLSPFFDQASQLQPFFRASALEKIHIQNINVEGAQFILENKTSFPQASTFDFSDDVPKAIVEEIEEAFDSPSLDGFVLPVVG